MGKLFRVPSSKIKLALSEFKPLEHRLEFAGQYHGIKFYNDSLATIPEATIHALKVLGHDVTTLIAGGYDRGLKFAKLGTAIKNSQLKSLILFPETGEKIWRALDKKTKSHIKKYRVPSMEKAVKIAFKVTPKEKICLLSPASASFGLFKDYEERGTLFKKLIKNK